MQDSSEASVLEEHQIGDPPLTSQQVCLCIAFSDLVLSLCTFMYRFDICYFMQESIEPVVLNEHQREVVFDPPLPPSMYMYVSLYLKTSFFVHVVYMFLILFII